ncbi:hypothetical protein VKT23_006337 [Stygiomarasmius scandens]|uniref:Ribonuclease H1 N-terminal domain-containing protein n=1 Tax=Marasmiellus scandens TaxID=2682957 RepID=A0ABR1JTT6_9AGAR
MKISTGEQVELGWTKSLSDQLISASASLLSCMRLSAQAVIVIQTTVRLNTASTVLMVSPTLRTIGRENMQKTPSSNKKEDDSDDESIPSLDSPSDTAYATSLVHELLRFSPSADASLVLMAWAGAFLGHEDHEDHEDNSPLLDLDAPGQVTGTVSSTPIPSGTTSRPTSGTSGPGPSASASSGPLPSVSGSIPLSLSTLAGLTSAPTFATAPTTTMAPAAVPATSLTTTAAVPPTAPPAFVPPAPAASPPAASPPAASPPAAVPATTPTAPPVVPPAVPPIAPPAVPPIAPPAVPPIAPPAVSPVAPPAVLHVAPPALPIMHIVIPDSDGEEPDEAELVQMYGGIRNVPPPPPQLSSSQATMGPVYLVSSGRPIHAGNRGRGYGLYFSWAETSQRVLGVSKAIYKKYDTLSEATEAYRVARNNACI